MTLLARKNSRGRRGGIGPRWLLRLSVILNIRGLEGKHSGLRRSLLWLWTRVQEIGGEEVVLLKASHRRTSVCVCFWFGSETERP